MATVNASLPLSYSTNLTKQGAKKAVVFDDLSYHVESLSDNEIVNGVIVFETMTETEKDEVVTFYNTNKNLPFDFVNPHDGVTYTLYFIDPPPQPLKIENWKPAAYSMTYSVVGE